MSYRATGSVIVIDTATNTVTDTIPVAGSPGSPVVLPDGSAVYVTTVVTPPLPTAPPSVSSEPPSVSVTVIDTATNTVRDTIPVGGEGKWWGSPVVLSDGSAIYVPSGQATLSVIDTATNTVTDTIPVRDSGDDMGGESVVLPDGSAVYVTNYRSGTVSVLDTGSNTVTSAIRGFGDDLGSPVTLPDGSAVYVPTGEGVSVIDTASNWVTDTIPVDGAPPQLVVLPDGSAIYVAPLVQARVLVIDTASNTVTDSIPVGE